MLCALFEERLFETHLRSVRLPLSQLRLVDAPAHTTHTSMNTSATSHGAGGSAVMGGDGVGAKLAVAPSSLQLRIPSHVSDAFAIRNDSTGALPYEVSVEGPVRSGAALPILLLYSHPVLLCH